MPNLRRLCCQYNPIIHSVFSVRPQWRERINWTKQKNFGRISTDTPKTSVRSFTNHMPVRLHHRATWFCCLFCDTVIQQLCLFVSGWNQGKHKLFFWGCCSDESPVFCHWLLSFWEICLEICAAGRSPQQDKNHQTTKCYWASAVTSLSFQPTSIRV